MWLVAGLGNPGTSYAHNRHNVGFLAMDALVRKYGASPWGRKFQGECAELHSPVADSGKVFLLKPQTYMNLSGESVAACMRFYKIPLDRLIVIQDELDLPCGKLRVKIGGGAGGHNGIKSIDAHVGKDYVRIRIGIGHPGESHEVSDYVLGDFGKAEWQEQEKMLDAITEAFPLLLASDTAGFMNKVALLLPSTKQDVKA